MKISTGCSAVLSAWLWCAWSVEASAGSCAELSRESVVRCALAASAKARAEREGVVAIRGKQRAVSSALPSSPVLSLSGARRTSSQADATNWYGQLSQEFELAGQRGAKRRAVAAEQRAQESVVSIAEREVAAAALRAYFEVLAARDALALAQRMEQAFGGAATAAKAAAEHGLSAGVDADLAELTALKLAQTRLEAQQRFAAASAELTNLAGLDPSLAPVQVSGELTPLPVLVVEAASLTQQAATRRPEITVTDATRASFEGWRDAYRRARVPNLTVHVFAQRDGFAETVLGAGLSFPLPGVAAHDIAGQAAENAALARKTEALGDEVRRGVRLEVVKALQELRAARERQALFSQERVRRADQNLTAIARQIAAGRLAIRDMLSLQGALIEFLNEHARAKLSLCLASVELVRAAGLPFEGTEP